MRINLIKYLTIKFEIFGWRETSREKPTFFTNSCSFLYCLFEFVEIKVFLFRIINCTCIRTPFFFEKKRIMQDFFSKSTVVFNYLTQIRMRWNFRWPCFSGSTVYWNFTMHDENLKLLCHFLWEAKTQVFSRQNAAYFIFSHCCWIWFKARFSYWSLFVWIALISGPRA